jgi:hypothetical protein
MVRRLGRHIRQNLIAWLALFVALGGTGAYAANTITTGDIVDNQVTSADVRDDNLGFGGLAQKDLGPGSVGTSEIIDGTVTHDDAAVNTFRGSDIADDSLTGSDINESTLVMPPQNTISFAGQGGVSVGDGFTKITSKTLPPGVYAIAATANVQASFFAGTHINDTLCEIRNPSGQFLGGARDRREISGNETSVVSLSMNGGITLTNSGEVGLYCRYQGGAAFGDGQMMFIRLDGTF